MQIDLIDNTPSDSDFVRHHTLSLDVAERSVGMALMTVLDYAAMESALTSHRWVARSYSYLWSFRRTLLDDQGIRARLHPQLTAFRGESGKLLILDDIIYEEKRFTARYGIKSTFDALHGFYADDADFMTCSNWIGQAKRLDVSPTRLLSALGTSRGHALTRHLAVGKLPDPQAGASYGLKEA